MFEKDEVVERKALPVLLVLAIGEKAWLVPTIKLNISNIILYFIVVIIFAVIIMMLSSFLKYTNHTQTPG